MIFHHFSSLFKKLFLINNVKMLCTLDVDNSLESKHSTFFVQPWLWHQTLLILYFYSRRLTRLRKSSSATWRPPSDKTSRITSHRKTKFTFFTSYSWIGLFFLMIQFQIKCAPWRPKKLRSCLRSCPSTSERTWSCWLTGPMGCTASGTARKPNLKSLQNYFQNSIFCF